MEALNAHRKYIRAFALGTSAVGTGRPYVWGLPGMTDCCS